MTGAFPGAVLVLGSRAEKLVRPSIGIAQMRFREARAGPEPAPESRVWAIFIGNPLRDCCKVRHRENSHIENAVTAPQSLP